MIDYAIHECGDVFYLTADGSELTLAIRMARVFKRVNGRSPQMHHHGSFDVPNSCRVSCQAAVLGTSS
jgi:hypothetical protein